MKRENIEKVIKFVQEKKLSEEAKNGLEPIFNDTSRILSFDEDNVERGTVNKAPVRIADLHIELDRGEVIITI